MMKVKNLTGGDFVDVEFLLLSRVIKKVDSFDDEETIYLRVYDGDCFRVWARGEVVTPSGRKYVDFGDAFDWIRGRECFYIKKAHIDWKDED